MLYPPVSDNQWWAFSPLAQGSASGLPAGVGVAPMPDGAGQHDMGRRGGNPGHGAVLVRLVPRCAHKCPHVEIDSFRQAGYQGLLQYVMPGSVPCRPFTNRVSPESWRQTR